MIYAESDPTRRYIWRIEKCKMDTQCFRGRWEPGIECNDERSFSVFPFHASNSRKISISVLY